MLSPDLQQCSSSLRMATLWSPSSPSTRGFLGSRQQGDDNDDVVDGVVDGLKTKYEPWVTPTPPVGRLFKGLFVMGSCGAHNVGDLLCGGRFLPQPTELLTLFQVSTRACPRRVDGPQLVTHGEQSKAKSVNVSELSLQGGGVREQPGEVDHGHAVHPLQHSLQEDPRHMDLLGLYGPHRNTLQVYHL